MARAELRDSAELKKDKSLEMLRKKKAELQKEFDDLSNTITNHTIVGQGRIIKAFPKMKHRDYYELIQELKNRFYPNKLRSSYSVMKKYLTFLRSLLKDRPYVKFVYMTGILPIAKYSSGSELNMFAEYTMAGEERFSEYFGFTEQEVDELYERYQERNKNALKVSREGLKLWYDGYNTQSGEKLYNPRSVVMALSNNNLHYVLADSFWTF